MLSFRACCEGGFFLRRSSLAKMLAAFGSVCKKIIQNLPKFVFVQKFDCGDKDLNGLQIHIDIFFITYIINGWFSRFRKNLLIT